MIKICKCGKEYEAGEVMFHLPTCPECGKLWDAEIDALESNKKEDEPDENAKLDALGIRPRHYKCTFDNFDVENEKSRIVLKSCRRMAESRKGLIVMYGNNGVGKTHLLSSTVREIGSGKIYKMIEIGMFIREYIGSDRITEQGQLDKLIQLPFLAIDEFDKCKRSESELIWLSYIIDERNERYRPTILSGNCHTEKIHADGKRCEKCFEAIVTPDILDRITQFGTVHYLDGESYRSKLRGKE